MNLADAYYLATVIHAFPQVELIAIGRFLPIDQTPTPDMPWGCSVRPHNQPMAVVWSITDWVALIKSLEPHLPSTPQRETPEASACGSQATADVSQAPPRRDAEHLRQPSLF